jgi:hypothetical protein
MPVYIKYDDIDIFRQRFSLQLSLKLLTRLTPFGADQNVVPTIGDI